MDKLKVFTSFSGYDSQCLALEQLKETLPGFDYELIGWSEIDKNAIKAHDAIFPQWRDRNYGDITKIEWEKVPDFDFFTYSSPCQDFSTAGLQKGGEEGSGTRSSLLWECKRAIQTKRPKYLMMENVKNLVGKKHNKVFMAWLEWLHDQGYVSYYRVLNASDYGVPQHRERVFVYSIREDVKKTFVFPPKMELTRFADDVLDDEVESLFYLPDKQIKSFVRYAEDKGTD